MLNWALNWNTQVRYLKVVEIEMMLASGEIRTYSNMSYAEEFQAVLCSLGSLGVIVAVRFQCEELFKLEQFQYPMEFKDVTEFWLKLINEFF